MNISTNIDHDFQRTIPTDGRWCQRCGLAEALWKGESCSEKSTKVPRYFYGRILAAMKTHRRTKWQPGSK